MNKDDLSTKIGSTLARVAADTKFAPTTGLPGAGESAAVPKGLAEARADLAEVRRRANEFGLISAAELAAEAGWSLSQLFSWMHQGHLPKADYVVHGVHLWKPSTVI